MSNFAVVFLAWGDKYIQEVRSCLLNSKPIHNYSHILITDRASDITSISNHFTQIIQADFATEGLLRKTEIVKFLPDFYEAYLFLDSDTLVLEDISLGFEKAIKHLIAVAPAPHYSLDHFWGFEKVMRAEGIECKGHLQYNTGVIFFKNSKQVKSVFHRWLSLAQKYQDIFKNDQPFFSLAMEEQEVNPYTLSISYNYRGIGEYISGIVRIWHSHGDLPESINDFKTAWPPRRAWPSKVVPLYKDQQHLLVNPIVKMRRSAKRLMQLLVQSICAAGN